LASAGDMNCFLNSFAILLTGSQNCDKSDKNSQVNVATKLRAALCLELMTNYSNYHQGSSDSYILSEVINDLKLFGKNFTALRMDDCKYMASILKRPIIGVHKDDVDNKGNPAPPYMKKPERGGILESHYDKVTMP